MFPIKEAMENKDCKIILQGDSKMFGVERYKAMTPTARLVGLFTVITLLSIFIGLTVYSRGYTTLRIIGMPLPSPRLPPPVSVPALASISLSSKAPSRYSPSSADTKISRTSSPKQENRTFLSSFSAEKFEKIGGLFQQTTANCSALFAGDEKKIKRAMAISKVFAALDEKLHTTEKKHQKRLQNDAEAKKMVPEVRKWYRKFPRLTPEWYINATQDCATFQQSRGYITSSLTPEEEDFPIAFSMLVFRDVEMVERLLRSVYRPQNRYCIHVDSKADEEFYTALQAVVACFPDSVRMSSKRVDVRWGTFTVLEPELICMQDLWETDKENKTSGENRQKWKYFINLTGQEFPLKTNHELVKIMTAYRGANNEEGTRKRANKDRWKTQAPHGIIPTKGGVHTLLNRATVDYILHNDTAKDFIKWLKTTGIPDETLFASINYNPQLNIPGTYNGTNMEKVSVLARYKNWYGTHCYSHQTVRGICILSTGTQMESGLGLNRYKEWYGRQCYSHNLRHGICILSAGDLPRLGQAPQLFANKFYLHQDPIVIGCLEEKIFNDTRDEFLGIKTFNTTFYSQQDFVLHQVPGKPFR